MKRILRGLFGLVGVTLLVLIVLFAVSRLRGPTAEQQEALVLLEEKDKPAGRNAFAAIWLLPYDVPESEQEDIAAADVRRFAATEPMGADAADIAANAAPFETVAAKRYPSLALSDPERELLCNLRDAGCLAHVRAHKTEIAEIVDKHGRLIERTRALASYDYLRSGFPSRFDAPFAVISVNDGMKLVHTRNVLDFVEGRTTEALHGICASAAPWRRIIRRPDILVDQMLGVAAISGAAAAFAEMLVELPAKYPLPAECASAFSIATDDELSSCAVMRGEFRYAGGVTASLIKAEDPTGNTLGNLLLPVIYDARMTRAQMAQGFAWPCTQAAKDQIRRDQPAAWPTPEVSFYRLECLGNAFGCVQEAIAAPGYVDYQLRMQDYGARLKLVSSLLWLREHAADRRPLAARLAARPRELHSPTRAIEIVDGGRALRIRQFEERRNTMWELPMPTYLTETALVR
ncbi:MAG TPA: hypothetical protein VGD21_00910 [Lysobacter sp.]